MQPIGSAAAQVSALLRLLLSLIVLLLAAHPALASGTAPLSSPPPLKIDLDAFDAMKQSMALPDGETLAYIDMGNPKGRAVVLIHGYTDSARDWVPMLPYLSKQFRLILVDIRGHGRSSNPECRTSLVLRALGAHSLRLIFEYLS